MHEVKIVTDRIVLGAELTGVNVRAEFSEAWTALRNFVEVSGGRDLFIHFIVCRKTGFREHCEE
jgi:hypothetical protein